MQSDCIPNDERDPTKYIFSIPDADSVQHIALFLNENEAFIHGNYLSLIMISEFNNYSIMKPL